MEYGFMVIKCTAYVVYNSMLSAAGITRSDYDSRNQIFAIKLYLIAIKIIDGRDFSSKIVCVMFK